MGKEEKDLITTTPDALKTATEKKADEMSEQKTVSVIETFTKTLTELIERFDARPVEKQIEVPDLIKQFSSPIIQVKELKHKFGYLSLAMAKAVFNRELNDAERIERAKAPISYELKQMGIDERRIVGEQTSKIMNASLFTDGGVFVPEVWDESIIPMLTANTVVRKAGGRVVDMPSGNISFAKSLTGATWYWVNETEAVTNSSPTFGSVTLNQHLGGIKVPVSNLLLKTGRMNTAMLIEDLIYQGMIEGEDTGLLLGTGSSSQPLGLHYQISSTNNYAMTGGGSPTAATRKTDLIAAETKLINANVKLQNVVWLMNPKVKQNLKTQVDSNSNPMDYARELTTSNTILGYPVFTTTSIPFVTTCNVYLIDMSYVIIGQGETPTIEFYKDGSYISGGVTISGQNTRESVFSVIEGIDIALTQALAGAMITGVTWGV